MAMTRQEPTPKQKVPIVPGAGRGAAGHVPRHAARHRPHGAELQSHAQRQVVRRQEA